MSRDGSLRKIGAAACLGLMVLSLPAWCQFEGAFRAGLASGGRGLEGIILLATAVSPEWACWLLGQKGAGEDGGILLNQFGDMGIVKISL